MIKQEVINASLGKRYCDMTEQDQYDCAIMAIQHGYNMRNQGQIPATSTQFVQNEFAGFLRRYYPKITNAELTLAIDMGVRGELGNKDTFVTIANTEAWVRAYMTSLERVTWMEEYNMAMTKNHEPAKSQRELDAEWLELGRALYQYYCETGTIFGEGGVNSDAFGDRIWDALLRMGKVSEPTGEVMKDIIERTNEYISGINRTELRATLISKDMHIHCLCLEYNFERMRKA